MKTSEEILRAKMKTHSNTGALWSHIPLITEAMREYASQAIEKCASKSFRVLAIRQNRNRKTIKQ